VRFIEKVQTKNNKLQLRGEPNFPGFFAGVFNQPSLPFHKKSLLVGGSLFQRIGCQKKPGIYS